MDQRQLLWLCGRLFVTLFPPFYLRGSVATTVDSTSMLAAGPRAARPGLSFVAVCGRRDTLPVAASQRRSAVTSMHAVLATFSYKSSRRLIEVGLLVGLVRPGSCSQWSFSCRGGDRRVAAFGRPWPGSRRRALRRLAIPAPVGFPPRPLEPGRAVHWPCSGVVPTAGRSCPTG